MRRALTGRLVVGACLLACLSTACTPDVPGPPPPSPSTTSPTPTENAQEREQRLAYEAAEKSYREFRAEFNRVLSAGGATKATPLMAKSAAGSYLRENVEVVQAYHGLGYHQEGVDRIVYVHRMGYSINSVVLATCEDASQAEIIGKRGKLIGRGDARTLELEVRRKGTDWKVWSGNGKRVKTCDD